MEEESRRPEALGSATFIWSTGLSPTGNAGQTDGWTTSKALASDETPTLLQPAGRRKNKGASPFPKSLVF
jgi:hypothetical protein